MLSNQSPNQIKYKNSLLISSPVMSSTTNAQVKTATAINGEHSDYIDEDYSDYVMKHNVPEMKILQVDYVQKPKAPPPPVKPPCTCKCGSSNSQSHNKVIISNLTKSQLPVKKLEAPQVKPKGAAKYLVYKKKHSIFGSSDSSSPIDPKNEKLKYVPDEKKSSDSKGSHHKKKYLIFDSKKHNSSNKLDSIQYYFDNKSYEEYVDNKLYGIIQQKQQQFSEDPLNMKGYERTYEMPSKSWEYRDHTKTENKLKLYEFQIQEKANCCNKSEGSTSGVSSMDSKSDAPAKRRNCRLKHQQKLTTSKSIGDLTAAVSKNQKTSSDIKQINQLFAHAKIIQNNNGILNFDKDKYKIHRKLNEYNVDVIMKRPSSSDHSRESLLTKDNLRRYERSKTELNLVIPSKLTACGFKNCKFSNCPMSNNSDNSSVASYSGSEKTHKTEPILTQKRAVEIRNNSQNIVNNLNNNSNDNLKTNICVNGKSNIIINDTKNMYPYNDGENFYRSKCKDLEDSNSSNKTTIKINDSCFVVNNNGSNSEIKMNNDRNKNKKIIELNNERNVPNNTFWDKNIKVKNNPPTKFDNKIDINNKIRNEENSVKIYVIGNDSVTSTTTSIKSSSSSHDCSDSDKDYGYFDMSSQGGRSSSPEYTKNAKKNLGKLNTKQLGCDGTMFWNNSFYDEEENEINSHEKSTTCNNCNVHTQEEIYNNYVCICRSKVSFLLFLSS